ncbi:GNAT family N-acetyltransferase [Gorillibacterium sp. sgz500922]|uniref:GNAT family N-acetyltransferase n=1 Tax=Gorillibacterium sp. sgz500922 TaxID=3446694 RepID=UPI003F680415
MIRKRTTGDDRDLLRLVEKELMPLARQTFPDLKVTMKDLRERMRRGTVYVAGRDGSGKRGIDGFVIAVVQANDLWIDMLAVNRDSQGKGLGASLLARAEQEGRRRGCTDAQLFVDGVNTKAQAFYAHKGYMISRYVEEVMCYQMTKSLNASNAAPGFGTRLPGPAWDARSPFTWN